MIAMVVHPYIHVDGAIVHHNVYPVHQRDHHHHRYALMIIGVGLIHIAQPILSIVHPRLHVIHVSQVNHVDGVH